MPSGCPTVAWQPGKKQPQALGDVPALAEIVGAAVLLAGPAPGIASVVGQRQDPGPGAGGANPRRDGDKSSPSFAIRALWTI